MFWCVCVYGTVGILTLSWRLSMPARYKVSNKRGAARKFKKDVSRTNRKNVAPPPMRGGYRL